MQGLRRSILVLGAALALVALPGLVAAADPSAKMIESGGRYAFSPTSTSMPVGSTLTWSNTTDAPHTVTADGGQFSSLTVAAGTTFSHTFSTAGTFAYHCTIHTYMTATVIVTAATGGGGTTSATPPPTDTVDFGTSDAPTRLVPLALVFAGAIALVVASLLWRRQRAA